MLKKYSPIISIVLLLVTLGSLWWYPSATPVLSIACLMSTLAATVYTIFEKHKESKNLRVRVGKDVLILILTILSIAFLSGLAAMLVNSYVSLSFGVIAGFVSAIVASFAVGYLVKRAISRLSS